MHSIPPRDPDDPVRVDRSAWAIVTRPAPDHLELVSGVREMGLRVLHAPLQRLEPVDEVEAVVAELDRIELAIVTSPATARFLLANASCERLARIEWLAPGAGTARILRSAGLPVDCPEGDGTSEAMLALPRLGSVRGLEIAILGAPGGRKLIAEELQRRGARVRFLYLYRRVPTDLPPEWFEILSTAASCVVLVSSVQILEAMDAAVPDALRQQWARCGFVVSSSRVEAACRARGLMHVQHADGASSGELLRALKHFLSAER